MNQVKIFLLFLAFVFCNNSIGQKKGTQQFIPPVIVDKDTPSATKTVSKDQVLTYLIYHSFNNISTDSLSNLCMREFHTKEYDAAKQRPSGLDALKKAYPELWKIYPDPLLRETEYASYPIISQWSTYDTVKKVLYINTNKEIIAAFTNKIHDSKIPYGVKLFYPPEFTYPLKIRMNANEYKDLLEKSNYKNKAGKWVTNKNIYITYIYKFDKPSTKIDSNFIFTPIERIEVWMSKERQMFLGEIQKREAPYGTATIYDDIAPESGKPIYDEIYELKEVDTPASYDHFFEYLESEIEYPYYEKDSGIQGTVRIKFTVEKDGSLSQIYIEKGVSKGLNNEAIRVIKKISGPHKWKPAIKNGKAVRQKYLLPINFSIQ